MRPRYALLLGPLLGLAALLLPLPGPERRVAALTVWMVAWWLTEAVPLGITALLPLALLPALGILTPAGASSPYANELIFLFLAGFLLARALEHWRAHERLAYAIVKRTGLGGPRLLFGLMLATGVLSMWISNTATAAMMYPIALALGTFVPTGAAGDRTRTALMLGIAFAASIGGMGTLIGTPPNLIMAAAAESLVGRKVGFGEYLLIGVPTVLILLPMAWALLSFVTCRGMAAAEPGAQRVVEERHDALGPLVGSERRVVMIFALTALGWIWPGDKPLTDAAIGLLGAVLLFVVPSVGQGTPRPLLQWEEAKRIPWDVLLLFGGGLSLAAGMEASGLTARLAGSLAGLGGLPRPLIYLALAALVVALSELASNTAVAALMMPLVASLGGATGIPPLELIIVTGLSASLGFALPVATPPNAIAFGSGFVPVRTMFRAGILLDLIGIVVVVLLAALLIPVVLS